MADALSIPQSQVDSVPNPKNTTPLPADYKPRPLKEGTFTGMLDNVKPPLPFLLSPSSSFLFSFFFLPLLLAHVYFPSQEGRNKDHTIHPNPPPTPDPPLSDSSP